jgi:hypothetical protein
LIEPGIYELKSEFFSLLNIKENQYKKRREDLMQWLYEFYDYEILEGRPLRIRIIEVYGEYQPLPRRGAERHAEKVKDYEDYVKAVLTPEYQYTTKRRMARKAIYEFGAEKYGHTNQDAVARRYVGPAMDEYGENDNCHYWVWYDGYEPLTKEELEQWRTILQQEHISELEASNAFYKQAQGQDISKELSYYKKAVERVKQEMGGMPILSTKWKLKAIWGAGSGDNPVAEE